MSEYPRQQVRDLFSRVDELLIILVKIAILQAKASGVSDLEIQNIIGTSPEGTPGQQGRRGRPGKGGGLIGLGIIAPSPPAPGAAPTPTAAPAPEGGVGKPLPPVISPSTLPLQAQLLDVRLPVLYVLSQTLGYSHHKFITVSYATTEGKTLIKDLDSRLGLEANTLPEQVVVSPSTACQVEFDSETEENQIASTTPALQANAGLTSPLHVTAIHHKAVSTAGILNVWMFWR
ncbi:MAG: hypothetical protein M1503_03540 [Thaumarchaeota archaeon]|nr:hypothetical protein [Nitrososphaerota archaeon]MCL5317326.1 hypothetical protein [Nitrososphaerota archaeon]